MADIDAVQVASDIIVGVIANGATHFIEAFGAQTLRSIKRSRATKQRNKTRYTETERLIQNAISQLVVEQEHIWKMPEIEVFLQSPEVAGLVNQLFFAQLAKVEFEGEGVAEIQEEFTGLLRLHEPNWSKDKIESTSRYLFSVLRIACENALDLAIQANSLPALEAMLTYRHFLVTGQLEAIRRNVELLKSKVIPTRAAYLEFERALRVQIKVRHQYIVPPNFDERRKHQLDDLYVEPAFVPPDSIPTEFQRSVRGDGNQKSMSARQLVNGVFRAVILGNPGGGKSTFAAKITCDLADGSLKAQSSRLQGCIPFLVILREYGAEKRDKSCSILQFIALRAQTHYQLPRAPLEFIEYALLNNRAAVIFDGLDELLDTAYRQEISADIEAFASMFPNSPIIVTSRKVGYDQAPLDVRQFTPYILAPFDEEKTELYVRKWFRVESELPTEQYETKVSGFLKESAVVPDLRSNPLLLALMCNIYRGDGYIPKNRPDVYEKCALMLFERWDKGRNINYLLPIEAHVRPAMVYLAHWIYSDPARQSGVTETELLVPATEYLHAKQFEDRVEAEYAARSFIEFCRGRAWVFTDTGTTREGERLYQFTHRTFLEYFTAAYLVRTHSSPTDLLFALVGRIRAREWDVVTQLAFQLQSKQQEAAADSLLMGLLQAETRDSGGWNVLDFAVRCLEFMVPSPHVKAEVARRSVIHAIEQQDALYTHVFAFSPYLSRSKLFDLGPLATVPLRIFASLLSVSHENLATVRNSVIRTLVEYVKEGGLSQKSSAFEALLFLVESRSVEDAAIAWREVASEIRLQFKEIHHQVGAVDGFHAYWLLMADEISVTRLVEWHGVQGLFVSFPSGMGGWAHPSVVDMLINELSISHRFIPEVRLGPYIFQAASALLVTQPPWVSRTMLAKLGMGFFGLPLYNILGSVQDYLDRIRRISEAAPFLLTIALAVSLEYYEPWSNARNSTLAEIRKAKAIAPIADLLSTRYADSSTDTLGALLALGFTNEQAGVVAGWIAGTTGFVKDEIFPSLDVDSEAPLGGL